MERYREPGRLGIVSAFAWCKNTIRAINDVQEIEPYETPFRRSHAAQATTAGTPSLLGRNDAAGDEDPEAQTRQYSRYTRRAKQRSLSASSYNAAPAVSDRGRFVFGSLDCAATTNRLLSTSL